MADAPSESGWVNRLFLLSMVLFILKVDPEGAVTTQVKNWPWFFVVAPVVVPILVVFLLGLSATLMAVQARRQEQKAAEEYYREQEAMKEKARQQTWQKIKSEDDELPKE